MVLNSIKTLLKFCLLCLQMIASFKVNSTAARNIKQILDYDCIVLGQLVNYEKLFTNFLVVSLIQIKRLSPKFFKFLYLIKWINNWVVLVLKDIKEPMRILNMKSKLAKKLDEKPGLYLRQLKLLSLNRIS